MSVPAVGVLAQQVDQDEPTFQELMQGRAPHPLKQRRMRMRTCGKTLNENVSLT